MRLLLSLVLSCLLVMMACGDLSEQQANHQKLREGLKKHEVRRVTENEILEAAFKKGDAIVTPLINSGYNSSYWLYGEGVAHVDSLNSTNNEIKLQLIPLGAEPKIKISELEQQLIEAYQYSYELGQNLSNNVQLLDNGEILYTSPAMYQDSLYGIWSLLQNKRTIVLDFEGTTY